MCGIVGYIGFQKAARILVEGLKALEYRGYDSAGLALASGDGPFRIIRASGKLKALCEKVDFKDPATLGLGHTRWATHGRPTEENAHPHTSDDGRVVAVHNGIFENYLELRQELQAKGHVLATETDTECLPMLISAHLTEGMSFLEAFQRAVGRLRGIYALACMDVQDPERILAARSGPPLVLGLGEGEYFLASDVLPLLKHTRQVIFLEDGDLAEITRDQVRFFDGEGRALQREIHTIPYDPVAAEKGGYKHFMLKEIFEQPQALSNTLLNRLPVLEEEPIPLDLPEGFLKGIRRILILACGTSWHAGLVGKFFFEQLARVGTEVDYASEFRYREPVLEEGTLALAITQSGETADTLAALKEAERCGARTLAICNAMGSTITRQAQAVLYTHAGPEIGVASTKAFTTQLAVLLLLALSLGEHNSHLEGSLRSELLEGLRRLPAILEHLHGLEPQIHRWAKTWKEAQDFLYLGRGPLYPIALEGALKLKEISYIHAEGYPAGEMKHGPIALIDSDMPVVALLSQDRHREKTLSNLQEAAAREGRILALATEGDRALEGVAEDVLYLPSVHPWLAPILYVLPLQILAYHISVLRGCDVDQPRNLAKSVTVE